MSEKIYTPNVNRANLFKTPRKDFRAPVTSEGSESDESMHSGQSTDSVASGDLSLVAEFDELIRYYKNQRVDEVEDMMIELVQLMREQQRKYKMAEDECKRLQSVVNERNHSLSDMESKLNIARKMVDQEKRRCRKLHEEEQELRGQIDRVKEFLFKGNKTIYQHDVRDKLPFLKPDTGMFDPNVSYGQLKAIPEVNTTGSLLSDFSYSRSEDDLDNSVSYSGRTWKKPRLSAGPIETTKKRMSTHERIVEINKTDTVRATTTLTLPKHGPITATSIIESVPCEIQEDKHYLETKEIQTPTAPQAELIYEIWQKQGELEQKKSAIRQHVLQQKTIVMPDTCGFCSKKLRFGKTALKCKDCRVTCHPECKKDLPLPCIPYVHTPTRNVLGLIGDFTPTSSPMVPAIIVHCVNEIELRGFQEIGLYRIPGSEREVKQLKEKFLRGKGAPNLKEVDIHVLCGTIKDFLRFLNEPIATYNLWPRFVRCVEDQQNVSAELYRIIAELPQPNRDTLAFMMLHLKRVSTAVECKMPISNLSKIFGPTIVGYSSANPEKSNLLTETRQQNMVMEAIMNLPTDYWSSFVDLAETQPTPRLQQTPSTDSLLRPQSKNLFTPHGLRSAKRKFRYFTTPPNSKTNN